MTSFPLQLFSVAALSLFLLYRLLLKPLFNPLRHLPSPDQGPLYKRFLIEPQSHECKKWLQSIPNNGLIRYYGIMGRERVLVTDPQGVKDILQLETYKFEKPPALRTVLQGLLGDGLVTAEGQNHRVSHRFFRLRINIHVNRTNVACYSLRSRSSSSRSKIITLRFGRNRSN